MKNNESYIARRRFLCGMVGGGAAALGATAVGPLTAYVGNLRSEPLPDFIIVPSAEYQLDPGQSKIVRYGPAPILLLRTREPEAELKVFWATCTHFDCIVGFKPDENIILCECHKGRFDLQGQVLSGPPPKPLPELSTRELDDQRLVIALEEKNLDKALEQDA
jgi:cytochrome b6-f complex iron-sulfur subunit